MTTLSIEGRKVKVSDDFLSMTPEQQNATVDEIAAQMNIESEPKHPVMSQVNRGIAESVGGLVDIINPFDKHTGSAVDGIAGLMESGGVEVASGDPDGFGEGLARGVGQGVGGLVPAAKGLQVMQQAPGMVGRIATNLFPQAATKSGAAIEALSAGVGRGASEALEDAGAPEWVQNTAEIAAPAVALPAFGAAARGTASIAKKLPGASIARRAVNEGKRAVFPMTEQGAEEVAAERLRNLVGGEERAADLGRQINTNDELGLSPAQQTGDPNLLALEAQAGRENPLVRESLSKGRAASRQKATDVLSGDGEIGDARVFFAERIDAFRTNLDARVDHRIEQARAGVEATGPKATETDSSARVVDAIKAELDGALLEERALWGSIPRDSAVGTSNAKRAAQSIVDTASHAQREDVPKAVSDLLTDAYGDTATVNDMHGAYSKLRQVARSAMAGTNQNKNTARIANEVAEAILKDLGATDGATGLGRQINEARAFSRALHETFDQGTVGRILNRTIDGDESMAPGVSLARTIGRGGSAAKVSARDIEAAAPKSRTGIADYLRGKFASTAFAADGSFTPKRGREWLRNNAELLADYPELRTELAQSLANGDNAAAFAARADARLKLADKSALAAFNKGQDGKAVLSIIGADNPAQSARTIIRTARKDKSGKALAGVKSAFSDYLIDGATSADGVLAGKKLTALLNDKKLKPVINMFFDAKEQGRMRRIASQLAKVDAAPASDLGTVLDSPANKMIEMVVRIAAAQHGGAMGGGSMGGSLQTANIFSERARNVLRNLTNDRARQLLIDAIEDPELFKMLLRAPQSVTVSEEAKSRLAPYLIGAASLSGDDE